MVVKDYKPRVEDLHQQLEARLAQESECKVTHKSYKQMSFQMDQFQTDQEVHCVNNHYSICNRNLCNDASCEREKKKVRGKKRYIMC
jgi:hypothetical protein